MGSSPLCTHRLDIALHPPTFQRPSPTTHKPYQVQAKLDAIYQQVFFGDDDDERLFYWANTSDTAMAYIYSVDSNDVRSEGMSYGMMIALQLNKQTEFDALWRWAKTYMQHNDDPTDPRDGYFSWHCTCTLHALPPSHATRVFSRTQYHRTV